MEALTSYILLLAKATDRIPSRGRTTSRSNNFDCLQDVSPSARCLLPEILLLLPKRNSQNLASTKKETTRRRACLDSRWCEHHRWTEPSQVMPNFNTKKRGSPHIYLVES